MVQYPEEFMKLLASVTAKRPRTVIDHILTHGHITSEELKTLYGYEHPPRAIRDVREHGIPIDTYYTSDSNGKRIGAYKFGDPEKAKNAISKSSGRTVLSKSLKNALVSKYGSKCFIYLEEMNESVLQVDHRIPYEIGGECDEKDIAHYMLLSPSANRAKSWTCEHCENWNRKDREFCLHCFWAYPEEYEHVAGKHEKVITLHFSDDEIEDYCKLIELVGVDRAQSVIKRLLHDYLD